MHSYRYILLCFCLLACGRTLGQEGKIWTLEQCLITAVQNAPTSAQAQLETELADWDLKTAKSRRLPNVSASSGLGKQLGYTIDPTTNTFDNQQIGYNGINLNAELTVFAGGSVVNNVAAQKHQQESAQWQFKEVENQLKLRVLAAYLSSLLGDEQVRQMELEQQSLQAQKDNIKRQIEAGTRSANERLELEIQMAQNQQLIIQAKQQSELALAELRFLLVLSYDAPLQLAPWESRPTAKLMAEDWQTTQLVNYPSLQDRKAQVKAAEYRLKAARGGSMPSVTLFGSLSSNYSSVSQKVIGFESESSSEDVSFMGTQGTLIRFDESPIYAPNPYFSQLRENFGQQIGVFLSVPIFQQGRNHLNTQRTQVELQQARVALKSEQQQLTYVAQQALISQETAWQAYEAAANNVRINTQLLKNKEREYSIGACNALDYFIVRNRSLNAQRQLLSAKYDYYYRSKVLALYQQGDI
ncbi:MAG: TolC family protein [Bacteroidia bacterium]